MLLVIVTLITGCSKKIDAKEANTIAIQTAIKEGYDNPQLFTDYNMETKQVYKSSTKENKDLKTWEVVLFTDEREQVEGLLGDIIYYIDIKNGDIIEKISGVD